MADTFPATSVLHAFKSFLQGRGRIDSVEIGEPTAPPLGKVTGAVLMEGIGTPEAVLDAAVRLYRLTLRLYRGFLEDGENTEIVLAEVTGAVLSDLDGDADVGGLVRAIDVAGQHSGGLTADWGYLEADGGVTYRIVDISVPLIVDEAAGSLQN